MSRCAIKALLDSRQLCFKEGLQHFLRDQSAKLRGQLGEFLGKDTRERPLQLCRRVFRSGERGEMWLELEGIVQDSW